MRTQDFEIGLEGHQAMTFDSFLETGMVVRGRSQPRVGGVAWQPGAGPSYRSLEGLQRSAAAGDLLEHHELASTVEHARIFGWPVVFDGDAILLAGRVAAKLLTHAGEVEKKVRMRVDPSGKDGEPSTRSLRSVRFFG